MVPTRNGGDHVVQGTGEGTGGHRRPDGVKRFNERPGLALFFRFTKLGLGMRAAAVNRDSSRLVGVRVSWMFALGWGIATVLGAVAGMMIAPVVFLDPNMMVGIQLYAFAAATEKPLTAEMIARSACIATSRPRSSSSPVRASSTSRSSSRS